MVYDINVGIKGYLAIHWILLSLWLIPIKNEEGVENVRRCID